MVKLQDFIHFKNICLTKNSLTSSGPKIYQTFFTRRTEFHDHNTRGAANNSLTVPFSNASIYGTFSIKTRSISSWNRLQNLTNIDIHNTASPELKNKLFDKFFESYDQR